MNKGIVKVLILIACSTAFTPAFALSSGDLVGVTNGTVNFDTKTNTTTIATPASYGSATDVNWNKFNINHGETLTNQFNGLNQTIVNRVTGLDLSTISGTINAVGMGAATGKVLLINPNGILFNGATVNVGSLMLSTLNCNGVSSGTFSNPMYTLTNADHKNLQVYNSTIETQAGADFFSNGNIDMRNSTISSDRGAIQIVTADGVNYMYTRYCGQDPYATRQVTLVGLSDKRIDISGTKILGPSARSNIDIYNDNRYAGPGSPTANTDITIYSDSTIETDASLRIVSTTCPNLTSNVNIYGAIKGASVQVSSTSNIIAKDITANNSISLITAQDSGTIAADSLKLTSTSPTAKIFIGGLYDIKSGLNHAGPATSGNTYYGAYTESYEFGANAINVHYITPPSLPTIPLPYVVIKPTVNPTTSSTTTTVDPQQYTANANVGRQTPLLPANTKSPQLAGAAARIRPTQKARFVGYLDENDKSKIVRYELLK